MRLLIKSWRCAGQRERHTPVSDVVRSWVKAPGPVGREDEVRLRRADKGSK